MDLQPGLHAHEVRRLVDCGMNVDVDTLWPYTQMANDLGRPIDGSDGVLQDAIRRLSRDHGIEFKNVRKIGYIRLTDAGIADQAGPDRLKVKRRIGRAAQRSGNIRDFDALNDSLKREVDTHRTVLALLRAIVKPAAVKQVRQEVDRRRAELDVDATLTLFKRQRE